MLQTQVRIYVCIFMYEYNFIENMKIKINTWKKQYYSFYSVFTPVCCWIQILNFLNIWIMNKYKDTKFEIHLQHIPKCFYSLKFEGWINSEDIQFWARRSVSLNRNHTNRSHVLKSLVCQMVCQQSFPVLMQLVDKVTYMKQKMLLSLFAFLL